MIAASMWLFVIAYGLLGLAGLIVPSTERKLAGAFVRSGRVRGLGVLLLALGVYLFLFADRTNQETFVKIAGVVHVLVGGVNLLLPEPMVVFNEAYAAKSAWAHRAVALGYLVVAYLFYTAASRAAEVAEVVEDVARLPS